MRCGGFVVPYVRAVPKAAANMIVRTLEGVEFAVSSAKARSGHESGQVGARRFFDGSGQGCITYSRDELLSSFFERRQARHRILRYRPRVSELSCVPVADDRVFVALGSVPAASLWSAVWEMPGQKESVLNLASSSDFLFQANCADRASFLCFRTQLAVA